MFDYSEKEVALIGYFFPNLTENNQYYKTIPPISMYRMMIDECFLRQPNGNNVFKQSLWNTYRCFNKTNIDGSRIYRMTPEWDALILNSVLGTKCYCTLSEEMSFVTCKTCCEVCDAFELIE